MIITRMPMMTMIPPVETPAMPPPRRSGAAM
jgi:hypothetical protein